MKTLISVDAYASWNDEVGEIKCIKINLQKLEWEERYCIIYIENKEQYRLKESENLQNNLMEIKIGESGSRVYLNSMR